MNNDSKSIARKNSHGRNPLKVLLLTGSPPLDRKWLRVSSFYKPFGDICQRYPNFPKVRSKFLGLDMTEKIDVLTGKNWKILIKNHRNWQKCQILIVFCNFFEIIIIRQLKSNKTFFIFNLFDLLNLTNFRKKTSRGQIGRVFSNGVGSKMIPVSRVHQTDQS